MLHGFRRAGRSPAHSILLLLLLTLAAAAFMLGALLWHSTAMQTQQIEDSFTLLVTRRSVEVPSADGLTREELHNAVLDQAHIASENHGRVLVGVSDHTPVSIRTLQPGSPSTLYDDDRSIVMVEAVCEASWLLETPLGMMRHDGQNIQAVTMLDMVTVRVEHVLAAHPAYRDMPDALTVYSYLAAADGRSLFVPGERYVLIARYSPPTYTAYGRDLVEQSPGSLNIPSAWLGESFGVICIREDGKGLAASDGVGNFAVLSPDDERITELQSWVERCNSSAAVFGVDDLNHLVYFHEGAAVLTQGQSFPAGATAPVCIVSETYAAANGLSIGDSIHLDLYQAPFTGDDQTRATYILDRRAPCVQQLEATVIGLYDMPWKDGETSRYGFNINTIFVPRLALCEEGDAYSAFSNLGLNGQQIMDESHLRGHLPLALESISLKHGGQEAYMRDLAAHGLDDDYVLYDGGYSRIAGALNRLKQDGVMLAVLCLMVWIALTLIALITHTLRLRNECRILRLLGTSRRRTRRFALGTMLPCSLAGVISGVWLGAALCGRVLDTLRHSAASEGGAFSSQISTISLLPIPGTGILLSTAFCALGLLLLLTMLLRHLALPGKSLMRKGAE